MTIWNKENKRVDINRIEDFPTDVNGIITTEPDVAYHIPRGDDFELAKLGQPITYYADLSGTPVNTTAFAEGGTLKTITAFGDYFDTTYNETLIKGTLVTATAHGYSVGDKINISGTTNYNGDTVVTGILDADKFVINESFVANDATGSAKLSKTIVSASGHVFANGDYIDISGTTSYNGQFYVDNVVAGVSYQIVSTFIADDATGTTKRARTQVNSTAHTMITGQSVIIENSPTYEDSYRVTRINDDSYYIDFLYDGTETGTSRIALKFNIDNSTAGFYGLDFDHGIVYRGLDALFNGSGSSMRLLHGNMSLRSTHGAVYGFDDTGDQRDSVVFDGNIFIYETYKVGQILNTTFVTATTANLVMLICGDGLELGNNSQISIGNLEWTPVYASTDIVTGNAIHLNSGTTVDTLLIKSGKCSPLQGQSFTDIPTDVTVSADISNMKYVNTDANFARPGSKNKRFVGINIKNVTNLADSTALGYATLTGPEIIDIENKDVFVQIDAGWVLQESERFTFSDGRMTYIGNEPEFFNVLINGAFTQGSQNQILRVRIAKNGTTLDYTESSAEVSAGTASITTFASIELKKDDYLEIFTANGSGTGDITVSNLKGRVVE